MPGKYDASHCVGKCGNCGEDHPPDCIWSDDIHDIDTDCNGTWATPTGPNRLQTSDDNAKRISSAIHSHDLPWRVETGVALSGATIDTQVLRLLAGLKDCNNGYYAEIESPPSPALGILKLGTLIGGTFTPIRQQVTSGTTKLILCYDGTNIVAEGTGIGSRIEIINVDPLTVGKYIGVGTGNLGSGNTATFSSLLFNKGATIEHPECPTCIPSCCRGSVPDLTVAISSSGSYNQGSCQDAFGGLHTRTFDCGQLAGTRACPNTRIGVATFNPGASPDFQEWHSDSAWAGDGFCHWESSVFTVTSVCNGWSPENIVYDAKVRVYRIGNAVTCVVLLRQQMTSGDGAIWLKFTGTHPDPCTDWTSITLASDTSKACGPGATCTISA